MSCCESRVRTEERYLNVRKQLDDLGYHQVLGVESVSLVEHLLAELLHVTDCLNHYKDVTQRCLESQKDFDLGVEPYRQDNARLIQECNQLHMKLMCLQEDGERNVRELKKKVRHLESENRDLVFVNSQCLARISHLELECIQKSSGLLQLKRPAPGRRKKEADRPKSGCSERARSCHGQEDAHEPRGPGRGESEGTDQRVQSLTRLLNRAEDECQQHADLVSSLKLQIDARDAEIERLLGLLEGGRPLRAICKDYHRCEQENRVRSLEEELRAAEEKNRRLEDKLKETTASLHEAMSRAMALADRGRVLLEQLHGHGAADGLPATETAGSLVSAQDRLKACEERAEALERDLAAARQKSRQLEAGAEAARGDRQWLESQVEAAAKEKRRLVDRLDELHVVEQDMLEEIGRLKQTGLQQRQKILDLQIVLKSGGLKEQACQTNGAKNGSVGRGESNGLEADAVRLPAARDDHLRSLVEESKRALDEREQQLESLQRNLRASEQENNSLRTEFDSLRKSNMSLASHVEELQRSLMETKQQLAALRLTPASASASQVSVSPGSQDAELRQQLSAAQAELSRQRALCNQIKLLQQQADGALAEAQAEREHAAGELAGARERLARLDREHAELQREAAALRAERAALRESLSRVDQERDSLLISLDTKTEQVATLEQTLEQRDARVAKLRDAVQELQKKLSTVTDDSLARSQSSKALQRTVDSLREDLDALQQSKDAAVRENRQLQEDLAAAVQDNRTAQRALEEARREANTLRRQLQEYVNEVRRVEELLARKDSERADMLEHFRSLSVEATALESSNHSLEGEREEARAAVQAAEQRAAELHQRLLAREAAVHACEEQIAELTVEVAGLEARLRQERERAERQDTDLAALRQLCAGIDQQKEAQGERAAAAEIARAQLEGEVARLREEHDALREQLARDRAGASSLEAMLAGSRQEALEQRAANQALQSEVSRLRDQVSRLQDKLTTERKDEVAELLRWCSRDEDTDYLMWSSRTKKAETVLDSSNTQNYYYRGGETAQVHRLASQSAELAQQVTDLQREVTNERYSRVRAAEYKSTTL